jgi:hypothetical protein
MRKILCLLFVVFFFLRPREALAFFDPTSVPNNKVGIHVLQESDFQDAASLANSSGGDWGYVTVVIREDEMNQSMWQKRFDSLRELHLIPIVRIATQSEKSAWRKPVVDDAHKWADFLHSLNWVIENRYIILFNEPNHDKEWSGKSNPSEYAKVAKAFKSALKEKSNDFFILPAGLDVAANNSSDTMDAYQFWEQMATAEPDIFKQFDGWNSHSYPNPGFSGNVSDKGRQSISSFKDEVAFLEKFGLRANIPVFITETGWVHSPNTVDSVADNYVSAFETVWSTPSVIAVTPFVLNYSQKPFDAFSWKLENGVFLPQYEKVKSMKKTSGKPKQKHEFEWSEEPVPDELFIDSNYSLVAKVKNTGQSVWTSNNAKLKFTSNLPDGSIRVGSISRTLPGQMAEIEYTIDTPNSIQINTIEVSLEIDESKIGEAYEERINLVPPASIMVNAKLALKRSVTDSDFALLVYEGVRFIKKIDHLTIENGIGVIKEIRDLVPGKTYRFVLTKPYYLPVQTYEVLDERQTIVSFSPMLPIDLNNDGAMTWKDLLVLAIRPETFLARLSPLP